MAEDFDVAAVPGILREDAKKWRDAADMLDGVKSQVSSLDFGSVGTWFGGAMDPIIGAYNGIQADMLRWSGDGAGWWDRAAVGLTRNAQAYDDGEVATREQMDGIDVEGGYN